MTRYIVGFLLAIGLIVVVIILIVRALTSGPSNGTAPLNLNNYANTDTTVQLTVDSPVTASQNHHDIIVTIGKSQATLLVTRGYQGQIQRMKSYSMDASAYGVFLRALMFNGFTNGNNDPNLTDERGRCALGDRYIFEVLDSSGNDLQRYWYTSCGGGTFKGSVGVIRTLFENQIPDYGSLTSGVSL